MQKGGTILIRCEISVTYLSRSERGGAYHILQDVKEAAQFLQDAKEVAKFLHDVKEGRNSYKM